MRMVGKSNYEKNIKKVDQYGKSSRGGERISLVKCVTVLVDVLR